MSQLPILVPKKKQGRPTNLSFPFGHLSICMGGYKNLASHLGVSLSTIHKWANKAHRIPITTQREIDRLCKFHGLKKES